ncbi:MAG: sulfurtransferase TusA family protein [Pseudomonadota bacterium]
MTIKEVDARRLLCPLPVIRTQDAVAQLKENDQVVVTCSDPGAKHDIPSWCRINGHQIESISESNADKAGYEITITVRIGPK